MFRSISVGYGVIVALACVSCDKVPLLAPTNSTVTIDAQSRIVPTGGSTTVTATVIESSGTPVQNGTLVRFTTTLGRVDPAEAQTRNGVATTTFYAGNDSGMAEVRATSGGAGGATSSTPGTGTNPPATTTSGSNVVQIAVGAGAVENVTVRANPSTVSTTSPGTVTVIATVVAAGGRLLSGIPVSFNATRGTLSSTVAATDVQGEARVTLVTNADTTITAVAGTKTGTATVTAQPGPTVSLSCAVGSVGGCAAVSQGQTVVFTAQRGASSSNIASSSLDFGDGTASVNLGPLSNPVSVPHTYNQTGTFTARLTATDLNGETTSAPQVVQVAPPTVTITATKSGMTVTLTATVSAPVSQYQWDFGDGSTATTTSNSTQHLYAAAGTYTITMTATLQAGGSVPANITVVVP
jgi:PKD repeat protein